jgi:Arc/MetJ-type ribon-helix-helix transcriptional regulator
MDTKDHRLELRLPQHQVEQIDAICQSIDSAFGKSRSELVRIFITQGLNRYNGKGQKSPTELTLAERLTLFFQLETLNALAPPPSLSSYLPPGNRKSEVSRGDLIKTVYLNRFFWFFELDDAVLKKISSSLTGDALQTLLNAEPSPETIEEVTFVSEVIEMFNDIEECLDSNDVQYESAQVVRNRADRYNIPLAFSGFPKSMVQLNQIAALIDWLDLRRGGTYLHVRTSSTDNTAAYRVMLDVYRQITRNQNLTFELIDDLISDSRLRT